MADQVLRTLLPADEWYSLADINSAALAVEQGDHCSRKRATPIRVKARVHANRLYTVLGVSYYGLFRSYVSAWEMVPRGYHPEWPGRGYHDPVDDEALRGDHRGLLVTFQSKDYILTTACDFVMGMPSPACRVSLEDAQAQDAIERRSGWRALRYPGVRPSWTWVSGFPVATYTRSPEDSHSELFFRHGKRLDSEGIFLDTPEVWMQDSLPAAACFTGQMALL